MSARMSNADFSGLLSKICEKGTDASYRDSPTLKSSENASIPVTLDGNVWRKMRPSPFRPNFNDHQYRRDSVGSTPQKRSFQKCQTEPQLEHVASVAPSFLESPTARTDKPPVMIAPTAFPPLTPFLSFTWHVVTRPFV